MPFSRHYKAVLEIFWESAVQIDTLLTYLLTYKSHVWWANWYILYFL